MVPQKQQIPVLILKDWKGRGRSQGAELGPTELPSSFDVDVVVAAAYSDDDPQGLELLQVLPGQGDGVVHHGPHGFIQHLQHTQQSGQGDGGVHHGPHGFTQHLQQNTGARSHQHTWGDTCSSGIRNVTQGVGHFHC